MGKRGEAHAAYLAAGDAGGHDHVHAVAVTLLVEGGEDEQRLVRDLRVDGEALGGDAAVDARAQSGFGPTKRFRGARDAAQARGDASVCPRFRVWRRPRSVSSALTTSRLMATFLATMWAR